MICIGRVGTLIFVLPALLLTGQTPPTRKHPLEAQAPSTIRYSQEDGADVIEITNVQFELAGSAIPGRPRDEHLILRKTTKTREVIGDIGMQASSVVEAWPLGADLKDKPLYVVTVEGIEPKTRNDEVLVISRGLEEVSWWSVYRLGSGAHLLDTYVPLVEFPVRGAHRYAGLEAPPDDADDARLRAPNVVAVLTYASAERVIREALVTCDDAKRASLLRSYADASRTLTHDDTGLRFVIREDFPGPRTLATVSVPIANDDLDLAHAQVPAGLHIRVWKR